MKTNHLYLYAEWNLFLSHFWLSIDLLQDSQRLIDDQMQPKNHKMPKSDAVSPLTSDWPLFLSSRSHLSLLWIRVVSALERGYTAGSLDHSSSFYTFSSLLSQAWRICWWRTCHSLLSCLCVGYFKIITDGQITGQETDSTHFVSMKQV